MKSRNLSKRGNKPSGNFDMRNPFRIFVDIKKSELPFTLLMFSQFFLLITCFWILKPLKKGLFIERYDVTGFQFLGFNLEAPQAELLAKELNLVLAFVAMAIFSFVARRFARHRLINIMASVMSAGYIVFSFLLDTPVDVTIWAFYLFGDLFHMFMVVGFFAFLNDSLNAEQAGRLYGPIVLGGVLGGVFGASVVRAMISLLSIGQWLFVAMGVTLLISVLATGAAKFVMPPVETCDLDRKQGVWLQGLVLTAKSHYLISIAALVLLYEFVSVSADFQFTSVTAHFLDGHAISEHLSTVYLITNVTALVVQLLVTGTVMSKFGVGRALLVLPVAFIFISLGFMAAPVLWMGASMSIADNGLNYSINQSSKEALYVVASRQERYFGKAFIDIFVLRFAKAAGVGLMLLASTTLLTGFSNLRWLSLITVILCVVWLLAARYAGKHFRETD